MHLPIALHSLHPVGRLSVSSAVCLNPVYSSWSSTHATVPETSLASTKDIVRKKLALKSNEKVELSQLRNGRVIDLEDGAFPWFSSLLQFDDSGLDDDFAAFQA